MKNIVADVSRRESEIGLGALAINGAMFTQWYETSFIGRDETIFSATTSLSCKLKFSASEIAGFILAPGYLLVLEATLE